MASSNTYIPSEFQYEEEASPAATVVLRSEQYLKSPVDKHTANGSNVIGFNVVGNTMLDLSSIRLFADVKIKGLTATAEGTAAVANASYFYAPKSTTTGSTTTHARAQSSSYTSNEVLFNSTFGYFSSLEIRTQGGRLIERLDDAVCLGAILEAMSFSKGWCNTSGAFMNAQQDPHSRKENWHLNADQSEATAHLEIGAIKMLGFLNSGKYIIPNSLGGLVFSFTMASSKDVFVTNQAAADVTLQMELSNVTLRYDACTMSTEYERWFDNQYRTRGFRIKYDSYMAKTSNILATQIKDQTLQISLQAKRAKAAFIVVRSKGHIDSWSHPSNAFMSHPIRQKLAAPASQPSWGSYQLEISGVRYPPTAINDAERAHSEALKTTYALGDVQRQAVSYKQMTQDWVEAGANASATGALSRAQRSEKGRMVLALDFEKFSTTGESGIVVNPSSTMLYLNWPDSKNYGSGGSYEVTTYLVRSQVFTQIGVQSDVDF